MTPEELKRLRELEAAATSGPWVGNEFEMLAPQAPTIMRGNKRIVWAEDYHMNKWDAEFIAAAREALPKLLDIVEKVEPALKAGLEKVQLYEELATKACKEANELREERDALTAEVEKYIGQSDKFFRQTMDLEEERDALRARVERLREELELTEKYHRTKDDVELMNSMGRIVQTLERERDSLKAEYDKKVEDYCKLLKDREHYMTCTIKRDKTIERLTTERDRTLARVERFETALGQLKSLVDGSKYVTRFGPNVFKDLIDQALAEDDKFIVYSIPSTINHDDKECCCFNGKTSYWCPLHGR